MVTERWDGWPNGPVKPFNEDARCDERISVIRSAPSTDSGLTPNIFLRLKHVAVSCCTYFVESPVSTQNCPNADAYMRHNDTLQGSGATALVIRPKKEAPPVFWNVSNVPIGMMHQHRTEGLKWHCPCKDTEPSGWSSRGTPLWGTYIHGAAVYVAKYAGEAPALIHLNSCQWWGTLHPDGRRTCSSPCRP